MEVLFRRASKNFVATNTATSGSSWYCKTWKYFCLDLYSLSYSLHLTFKKLASFK